MAFTSSTYQRFKGQVVADVKGNYVGQCVSYVKQACPGLTLTATGAWKKGTAVRGASLSDGTAIATFDSNGKYFGHAAIYVSQDSDGLQVWDQWVGHPVAPRNIAFRGGTGSPVNDGDQFYVVE